MDSVNLLSIMAIAFFGSFGHCIGMCGGIVLAYTANKIDKNSSKISQSIFHIIYSLGRVLTYVTLGAIFGYLGGVAMFNNMANGTLNIIAGVFMLLSGLSLVGKIKFLTSIEYSISNSNFYKNFFKKILLSKTLFSFFILGMLNGLIPCGFVYFFAITAASTGDALYGAIVMLIFGISTIPALFSFGLIAGLFSSGKFKNIMIKIASIAIIVYGVFTIYNGYEYLVDPLKTVQQCH